jgi:hypothetical protein
MVPLPSVSKASRYAKDIFKSMSRGHPSRMTILDSANASIEGQSC